MYFYLVVYSHFFLLQHFSYYPIIAVKIVFVFEWHNYNNNWVDFSKYNVVKGKKKWKYLAISCIKFTLLLMVVYFMLWSLLKQLLRNKLVSTARRSIRQNTNLGELYRNMQQAYNEMQTPLVYQNPSTLVNEIRILSEIALFDRV